MKHLLFAAILLPSALIAQSPQPLPGAPVRQLIQPGRPVHPGQYPANDALPDNYQVTLTITDKEGQPLELSVVVASTQFTASLGEQNLNFTGTVSVEEAGILITYGLGWQTAGATSSSMQGSVRLKLGEEVQIIRAGSRMARISIKKLEPSKPK